MTDKDKDKELTENKIRKEPSFTDVPGAEEKDMSKEAQSDVWTEAQEIKEDKGGSSSRLSNTKAGKEQTEEEWERNVLNRLAFASLNEQRRSRRWGIFFKALAFIYIGALIFYVPAQWDTKSISSGKHTALINIEGPIAVNTPANADTIVSGLRAAFKHKNTKAVILRINSPGGSPVQAGYIYDEIRRLRKIHKDTKLYTVISDVCASGGYYIAVAADEIYADKASLVGSIGVLMNGFGFVDTMEKLGVERRLITAGEHKGILDPFSPVKKEELKHVQGMLDGVHAQFINVVKEGRGDRLKDSPEIFSGLFWNGEEAVKLGLVDGLGSSSYVARDIVGAEKIVDFTIRESYFDRFADRIGAAVASMVMQNIGLQTSPQM